LFAKSSASFFLLAGFIIWRDAMWCFQARRWVSAYLDEELASDRRAVLKEHLGRCADCAGELERLEAQSRALRQVGDAPPLPADLWSAVEEQLDETDQLRRHRRRRDLVVRAAAVAACVTLGFGSGALLSWRAPTAYRRPQPPLSEERLLTEVFDAPVFALGGEEEWSRCDPE
jgi:anti-sigma factor RsiW